MDRLESPIKFWSAQKSRGIDKAPGQEFCYDIDLNKYHLLVTAEIALHPQNDHILRRAVNIANRLLDPEQFVLIPGHPPLKVAWT